MRLDPKISNPQFSLKKNENVKEVEVFLKGA